MERPGCARRWSTSGPGTHGSFMTFPACERWCGHGLAIIRGFHGFRDSPATAVNGAPGNVGVLLATVEALAAAVATVQAQAAACSCG